MERRQWCSQRRARLLLLLGYIQHGDPATPITSAAFNPGPIPSGSTYYFHVKTKDNAAKVSGPVTLLVLQFDSSQTRFLRLPVQHYANVTSVSNLAAPDTSRRS